MPILVYPALVQGDQGTGYRAEFVDFPDLAVTGATSTDLLRTARDRLLTALNELEKNARDWPEPSAVEALGERVTASKAVLLLVDVQVDETPVRVNISLGDRLLRRLDDAVEAQNMTRSGFIAAAVRDRLSGTDTQNGPKASATSQRVFDEVAEVARRVNEAVGPESSFGRAVAELDAKALEGLRILAGNVAGAMKRPAPAGRRPENGRD